MDELPCHFLRHPRLQQLHDSFRRRGSELGRRVDSGRPKSSLSRFTDAILTFLRDVSEPFLGIFRRFIPLIGPLDLSPLVGLIVLNIVRVIVVNAIHG